MDLKEKFILYVGYVDRVDQYFCNSQAECFSLIKEKNFINYKIYKAEDAFNNVYSGCFEWDFNAKNIKMNIDKLKDIKRSQYREMRVDLFNKLDIKYIRALELNSQIDMQKIAELKKLLRDVTEIDLPNNENELLDYIPECFIDIILYLI